MPNFQRFALPDVGEGLTEADIVSWHVAVGDTVTVNQVIVEIETAKSLVELPSPWDGVVAELLVDQGQTVDVGTPIVVVDIDPHGEAPTADDGGTDAEATSGGVLVGYGTTHAATARRPRNSGGAAAAPAAVPVPAAAPVSEPLAVVDAAPAQPVQHAAAQSRQTLPSAQVPLVAVATASGSHVLAKPPVRKLARDLGIPLESVTPSGPGGIVTREDVIARVKQGEARSLATYPGDEESWLVDGVVSHDGRQTRVPVKSVRRRTAEAMVTSAFSAPHVTVFHTADVTKTMELVKHLREDREFADVRVTPLLIAAKALLLAIRRHPAISASWDEENQEIVYKHYINLGIAAATPRGLVVPNVKNAHRLTLHELAEGIADLTQTARAGKTQPADMTDGTVTITNVGVFGIDTGTPILNPGESAILAFGAITQRPWVHKGKVKPRWVTQLALSFDHRLVDGELGSRVLSDVARVLENPARGLVWA